MAPHSVASIIERQINRWNHLAQVLQYSSEPTHVGTAEVAADTGRVHPVICISRDLGAGARHVATELCDRLGYELIGSQLIDAVARDLQVQRSLIDTLDESDRGGLELLLDSYVRGREIEMNDYLQSLFRVIQTLAIKGGVVVLGRGGRYIVRDRAALNLLITAPLEQRMQNYAQQEGCSPEEAEQLLRRSDRNRDAFIQRHFHKDVHDPTQYDLVINTARIRGSAAVELILRALEVRGFDLETLAITR